MEAATSCKKTFLQCSGLISLFGLDFCFIDITFLFFFPTSLLLYHY